MEQRFQTLDELLDYIEHNCESLYVRDVVEGKPGNYALAELPISRALHHAFRWIREQHS